MREKRLLIEEAFLEDVVRVLKPGGPFYTATDVTDYAEHIETQLRTCPGLTSIEPDQGVKIRPTCTQLSRREWRCTQDQLPWQVFYALRLG